MENSTNTEQRSLEDAAALAWTQAAFTDKIKAFLSGKHLSICGLDSLINHLANFRVMLKLPAHPGKKSPAYHGLELLHCTDFAKMDPKVRAGLPAALIAVFGLTEQEAPVLLGSEGWTLLKVAFEVWCEPACMHGQTDE